MVMKSELIEMSDGAYIYAERYENKGKPLVLLIPGFCCTTRSFDQNVQAISETYEVVTYDPRGQGKSSKGLFGHTVERNAKDILEIIEHFGHDDVSIVSWSMAGQFVMDYVRQFGTKHISSITLADCPLHALGDEEWNAHGLRENNMDHFTEHCMQSYNGWNDYCLGFAKKIWGGIDDSRIEDAAHEFMKTPPWIAFAIYSDMVFRNGHKYLSEVDVPMLFAGADSRVTTNGKELASKWYPKEREGKYKSEVCTFDNGGHVFFDVEASKFNEAVLNFWANIYGVRK